MDLVRPSAGDLVAGLSVALVAIPQSLAYAELAGMPPQVGLYATAIPSIAAAAFVSSKYLQTGPVALTALLSFGALTSIAEPETVEYVALAALLALLVGLVRIGLGLVRLGRVAYLLRQPVLLGFTTGAAILIVCTQLPKTFGFSDLDGGVLRRALTAVTSPGDWNGQAMLFSAGVLVLMFGGRRIHRLFPGVLVAVIVGVIVSRAIEYSGPIVGDLTGGFVELSIEFPWSRVGVLIVPAIVIALVGFAEPSSIARTFAQAEGLRWNADREMVSQGVANVASGLSGAFPVGGSFSRSSLNRMAGATTAWAGAITGLVVLVAIPFTPLLEWLPEAVLGAIVIGAVAQLIKIPAVVEMVQSNTVDGLTAIATLAATIASSPHVERGVIFGVLLSFAVGAVRRLRGRVAADDATVDGPDVAPEEASAIERE